MIVMPLILSIISFRIFPISGIAWALYNELSLSQIADKMHYCNAAHLSNQFKKVCGLTPSHFKRLGSKRRSMLEDI